MSQFDETETKEISFFEIYFVAVVLGGTLSIIAWGVNMFLPSEVETQNPLVLFLFVFLVVAIADYGRQRINIKNNMPREKGGAEGK